MWLLQSASGGLKIDWANMPTYNTIMAVAVGAGLVGLVLLGREVQRAAHTVSYEGWALNFAVLGGILFATGLHMTLTWPLAPGGFPFDNIIFGETSLAFGALLLAAGLFLWRRGSTMADEGDTVLRLARAAKPLSTFVFLLGLSLIAIAVAGVRYQLFAAPPQEPISGAFAAYPLVEAIFISGLIALVGVGCLAFPFMVRGIAGATDGGRDRAKDGAKDGGRVPAKVVGWSWLVSGVVLGLFGAMNFFTHIGLIVNTM